LASKEHLHTPKAKKHPRYGGELPHVDFIDRNKKGRFIKRVKQPTVEQLA